MSTQIETTDTFGGESNYSWVKRWHCKANLTDAQAVRLAKKLTGWTGHPCRKSNPGEMVDLRPRGVCHVIFIAYAEPGNEQGPEVDSAGNTIETQEG